MPPPHKVLGTGLGDKGLKPIGGDWHTPRRHPPIHTCTCPCTPLCTHVLTHAQVCSSPRTHKRSQIRPHARAQACDSAPPPFAQSPGHTCLHSGLSLLQGCIPRAKQRQARFPLDGRPPPAAPHRVSPWPAGQLGSPRRAPWCASVSPARRGPLSAALHTRGQAGSSCDGFTAPKPLPASPPSPPGPPRAGWGHMSPSPLLGG